MNQLCGRDIGHPMLTNIYGGLGLGVGLGLGLRARVHFLSMQGYTSFQCKDARCKLGLDDARILAS